MSATPRPPVPITLQLTRVSFGIHFTIDCSSTCRVDFRVPATAVLPSAAPIAVPAELPSAAPAASPAASLAALATEPPAARAAPASRQFLAAMAASMVPVIPQAATPLPAAPGPSAAQLKGKYSGTRSGSSTNLPEVWQAAYSRGFCPWRSGQPEKTQ